MCLLSAVQAGGAILIVLGEYFLALTLGIIVHPLIGASNRVIQHLSTLKTIFFNMKISTDLSLMQHKSKKSAATVSCTKISEECHWQFNRSMEGLSVYVTPCHLYEEKWSRLLLLQKLLWLKPTNVKVLYNSIALHPFEGKKRCIWLHFNRRGD